MKNLRGVEVAILKHKTTIEKLTGKKLRIFRRKQFKCVKCGKRSILRDWVFIQNHYYVAPFSCNGGAYWTRSDIASCHIVCPKCSHRNYIYTHPQREKIALLEKNFSINGLFKSVEDEHDPQRF